MSNKSTEQEIWIVDDDTDDHELISEIFKELKWNYPPRLFLHAEELLERLASASTSPFIIISDVNLSGMTGFALRRKMLETPENNFHSVPFIFWSTAASNQQIREAYHIKAHGFFRKEASFQEWKLSLIRIIEYWQSSMVPSAEE